MFETLFGTRTAALTLLFLERHGEVWASQISIGLDIPINMIQKQLERFEKGGVIKSSFCGRRKMYRWNTSHPLHRILMMLLKRGGLVQNDPADGTYLSAEERLLLAESLAREANRLHPLKHHKPFTKTFGSFRSYETWRKKQKDPRLV